MGGSLLNPAAALVADRCVRSPEAFLQQLPCSQGITSWKRRLVTSRRKSLHYRPFFLSFGFAILAGEIPHVRLSPSWGLCFDRWISGWTVGSVGLGPGPSDSDPFVAAPTDAPEWCVGNLSLDTFALPLDPFPPFNFFLPNDSLPFNLPLPNDSPPFHSGCKSLRAGFVALRQRTSRHHDVGLRRSRSCRALHDSG